MSRDVWRASSGSGAESENEAEEEEETTSKSTGLMDDGHHRTLVRQPRRKKKKKKEEEDMVDMRSAVGVWATSLKGPHLDLMVSLKQLAEVRLMNTGEECLSACLTPASLRTIGIILEELIKDRMSTEYPPIITGRRRGHGDPQSQQGGERSSSLVGREEQEGTGHEHGILL